MTKREKTQKAILDYGIKLINCFDLDVATVDPISLCKSLRRIETQGRSLCLKACNEPMLKGEFDRVYDRLSSRLYKVLGKSSFYHLVHLNTDPRGCFLKVDLSDQPIELKERFRSLESDFVGDSLLAPKL